MKDSPTPSQDGIGSIDPATTMDAPRELGLYIELSLHAKGGLGEVLRAVDPDLHRTVAIKRLQARLADDPVSQRRFMVEAEITARLEHPGVVPVYGLFKGELGRPCYAMRFIEGQTLADAIKAFHTGPANPIGFRRLLQSFIQVCQTIAYANSRGVIHRDVKPGNVMLGKFGETLVVDWGLSKVVGRPDELRADSPEVTLQPVGSGSGSDTAMGSAVGTPAYMSPEQAAGRWDVIDVASDIYGLGAVLYTVLTGQPPFQKGNWPEIQQKIQRGDYPRPREIKKSAPSALEAICLKAMALDPDARYPSASALAGDIEHWLADEPVSAYRDPASTQLARWGRRHRPMVAAVAVLFVTVLIGLGVGLVVLGQANARTERHRQLAETNFAEAQRQRDLAQRAVDEFFLLGNLTEYVGTGEGALRAYQRAYDFYQTLCEAEPQNDSLRNDLARTYRAIGRMLSSRGKLKEGITWFQKASALGEELVESNPTIPDFQRDLAWSYNNLGLDYSMTGQPANSRLSYEKAITNWKGLIEKHPEPEFRIGLAQASSNLGWNLVLVGKLADALALIDQAVVLNRGVVRDKGENPEFQNRLAMSLDRLGIVYFYLGKPDEAMKDYQAALDVAKPLASKNPDNTDYQETLIEIHNNHGHLLLDMGKIAEARQSFDTALDLGRKLPGGLPMFVSNAWIYRGLAKVLHKEGNAAAARKALTQAIQIGETTSLNKPYSTYELACSLALYSAVVGEGSSKPTTEEQMEKRRYADQAMQALNKAIIEGWANVPWMKKDHDLDALRNRPEFNKLLADLEEKQRR